MSGPTDEHDFICLPPGLTMMEVKHRYSTAMYERLGRKLKPTARVLGITHHTVQRYLLAFEPNNPRARQPTTAPP